MYVELPSSPAGKEGWPWTIGPSIQFDVKNETYPRISIITPSFNQGDFIEETIRSILLQGYPNLEYIIIDGGSSDNSVEIIEKYSDLIDFWVSEPDRGQSHGINKGIEAATGELVCWINSDDYLLENALLRVVDAYRMNPDCVAWVGSCIFTDVTGSRFEVDRAPCVDQSVSFAAYGDTKYLCQPACFFKRSSFMESGKLDEDLHFVMDVDLWSKLSNIGDFKVIDFQIACARKHPGIKTHANPEMRYVERLVVSWRNKEYALAKQQFIEYSYKIQRRDYLNSPLREMLVLNLAWLYRNIGLKKLVERFLNRRS